MRPDHESLSSVRIGDLDINRISFDETVDWIYRRMEQRTGGLVCTPNVDYVVRARGDQAFRSAVASADLRVPDGMWIVYASRLAGRPLGSTVTGRLLFPAVAQLSATRGWPIALFGGKNGIAEIAASRLASRFPGLRIARAISPSDNFQVGSPEDRAITAELRAVDSPVIFVALGAPKQEIWMRQRAHELERSVLIGVGAAFDIVAGRYREAPSWMTGIGLEWLFRLAQEPRRLARRYLLDDPWIFYWALRTRLARSR